MSGDFSMPAEWQAHRRTWMAWPCRRESWDADHGLERAKSAFAAAARAIGRFEPVMLAARPADVGEVRAMTGCDIFEVKLDDSWARDIAPAFVKLERGGELAAVRWRFNGWGGKYASFREDALFARRLAEKLNIPLSHAHIVCEGGAVHGDGQGTLLTTEQCLLNSNRNPGLSKDGAERVFREMLGTSRVIWLGEGFSDAETDGHVDNIACFAGPGHAILGLPDSKTHPDFGPAMEAKRRLTAAGMNVTLLAQPRKLRHDRRGRLLPASYVNFYLCNGGLVMPCFDDPNDQEARAVLAGCFPGRQIEMLPAWDIVAGGGGIHCITHQEPA